MKLEEAIQTATTEKGLNGIMALVEFTGVPYARAIKVWRGDKSARICDYITIMGKLGKSIKWENV